MPYKCWFNYYLLLKIINIGVYCRKAHCIADSCWFLSLRKWDLLKRLMRMLLLTSGVYEGFGFGARLLGFRLGLGNRFLRERPGLYFFNLLALGMGP